MKTIGQTELLGCKQSWLVLWLCTSQRTPLSIIPPFPQMVKGAHDVSAELQSPGEADGLDFWLNVLGWTSVSMYTPSPNPLKWQGSVHFLKAKWMEEEITVDVSKCVEDGKQMVSGSQSRRDWR